MLTIDQLIYDPATNEGAKVGAFIVDADGHQLDVNADGSINVSLGAVTDLDIRNLVFATDKVDVSGSTVTLDSASLAALENITVNVSNTVEITNDAGSPIPVSGEVSLSSATLAALESITVSATDLDIRDLTFAADKVDASGSRTISSNSSIANSAVLVTTTAAALTPSPLSNRTTMIVQNLGSKEIFIGGSGVSSSNGIKVAAGANAELNYNASVALFARTASGTADVRILEAAY